MAPRSKIARMPAELRAWLDRALVERAFGDITELTAELNDKLAKAGHGDTIGKSAVGVHALKVRRAQEAIAASTRAMQTIAETARDDADLRGEALNAKLSTDLFEVLLDVQNAGDEEDPAERIKLLTKASLAAARLTATSVRQRQWRAQVEKDKKAAADAVTKIVRAGGLGKDQERAIREQILGIAKRAPAQAQPAGA